MVWCVDTGLVWSCIAFCSDAGWIGLDWVRRSGTGTGTGDGGLPSTRGRDGLGRRAWVRCRLIAHG